MRNPVNVNWLLFRDAMLDCANKFIPKVIVKSSDTSPWFNSNLKKLSNKKKRLYRKAKCRGTESQWSLYFNIAREFKHAVRDAKHRFYNHDLRSLLSSNPKKFWSVVKAEVGESRPVVVDTQGMSLADDDAVNGLNEFFTSMFTREAFPCPPLQTCIRDTMLDPIIVSSEGICKIINDLPLSSSPGCDGISTKFLKMTKHAASKILSIIFQQSLDSALIPGDWKHSIVVPIPKGPSPTVECYRPISLTCVSCKVLEHIIFSVIMKHLVTHNFFHVNQHGFRGGFSCEGQLFEFVTDIFSNFNLSLQTDAIFIDLAKAFDRVPHQRLINKVKSLGLHPSIVTWIGLFLQGRTQQVRWGRAMSNLSEVVSGVPQGSVLGPLLFLIYINDLPNSIQSRIRLYADDIVLYRPIRENSDYLILQSDLMNIKRWCNVWQMEVNVKKSKFMTFSRANAQYCYTYVFGNSNLERVTTYKYLGVHLTQNLSWKHHINEICHKAAQTLGFLRRVLRLASTDVRLMAYNTLVRSKLEYASVIWNPSQKYLIDQIEAIQNKAVRFIFQKYDWASITEFKRLNNIPLLANRRKVRRLVHILKLFLSDSSYIEPAHHLSGRLDHCRKLKTTFGQTDYFYNSPLQTGIRDWNSLPEDAAVISDVESFTRACEILYLK